MTTPKLNKTHNNPYLDTNLLQLNTLPSPLVGASSTISSDTFEEQLKNPNDDHKDSKDDAILQSIINLELIDMKSDEYKAIEINVGGIKYESTMATLCKSPTLSKLIKNNIRFIDRDGFVFKYILNYLRDNALVLPIYHHINSINQHHVIENDEYLANQLLFEAKYFELQSLIDELIMRKINSDILSTSSTNSIQKKHIHDIRCLINEEYPKLMKNKNDTKIALNHEWKLLFKYDASKYISSISPSAIIQNKCGGLRSILVLLVAMNQIFCVYFYEPWNLKAYRQKNFFYWIGEYLNDGLHKTKFLNFTSKKFKCTYAYRGEGVFQYTPSKKSKNKTNTLHKDYQVAFSFDASRQNNLVLSNLKGIPLKALAVDKDQMAISMCEVYHVALK